MKYILFTADFDENESKVERYENLDDIANYMDAYCDECEDYKKWFKLFVDNGYHYGEWYHYHLVIIEDKV